MRDYIVAALTVLGVLLGATALILVPIDWRHTYGIAFASVWVFVAAEIVDRRREREDDDE